MRTIRYSAAIVTIIMSLLDLPFALDDGGIGLPVAVRWLISLLGVAGIVAAVGLIRKAAWATPTVIAVGAVNLTSAVVSLVKSWDGAIIGLVLSAAAFGLAVAYTLIKPATTPQTS